MRALFRTLFVLVLVVLTPDRVEAASNFVEIRLPQGVRVELPRNWVALSQNQRITLDTAIEATFDAEYHGWTSKLPFAANLYNDRGEAIGIMNVRYYPDNTVTQAELLMVTARDIAAVDEVLHREMNAGAVKMGGRLLGWNGTSLQTINGIHVLVTDYRRASLVGPGAFRVRLARVLDGVRSFTLTVSYRESDEILLRAVTDRILASLRRQ